MTSTVGGRLGHLGLRDLRPDPDNPRFPHDLAQTEDTTIYAYIARHYAPLEIARSIAKHGYFESEPLIAIPDDRRRGAMIVVEGNRRLTALRGLSDETIRATYPRPREWNRLANEASIPEEVPVVVAGGRDEIAAIIGYRHISGIEPWDPFAKARFIAALVDGGRSFDDVASEVGESSSSIRSNYRNQAIVVQARQEFSLATTRAEENFGTFTRAMSSVAIRAYIGAPAPRDVHRRKPPLSEPNRRHIAELFEWMFGSEKHAPVIRESRDLSKLAAVLQDDASVAALKRDRNLTAAYFLSTGFRETLVRRVQQADALLTVSDEEISPHKGDATLKDALKDTASTLRSLQRRVGK